MSCRVCCVLVNWNGWQDTDECLRSLAAQDVDGLRVVVVDNGSANESVKELRARHPWVTVVEAAENGGFAKGCNLGAQVGARAAGEVEYLWFLNNDTVCPADTLRRLLAVAAPDIIVGAELRYADAPAKVQAWGGGTVSRWTGVSRHYTAAEGMGPGSYLTFACVLVGRALFERLGGLYEGGFMYFEDSDFCLRAQAAGARLTVAPRTAVLHKEGGSQGGMSLGMTRIFTDAGMQFMRRHSPVPWVGMGVFALLRLGKRMARGQWQAVGAVWRGVEDGWRGGAEGL